MALCVCWRPNSEAGPATTTFAWADRLFTKVTINIHCCRWVELCRKAHWTMNATVAPLFAVAINRRSITQRVLEVLTEFLTSTPDVWTFRYVYMFIQFASYDPFCEEVTSLHKNAAFFLVLLSATYEALRYLLSRINSRALIRLSQLTAPQCGWNEEQRNMSPPRHCHLYLYPTQNSHLLMLP